LLDDCSACDARTNQDETQKQPSDENSLRHRHFTRGGIKNDGLKS